jgi:hypothetical protein
MRAKEGKRKKAKGKSETGVVEGACDMRRIARPFLEKTTTGLCAQGLTSWFRQQADAGLIFSFFLFPFSFPALSHNILKT